MTSSVAYRLRSALKTRATPLGLEWMALAALGDAPAGDCETCQMELPAYADAILAGGEGAPAWQQVRLHLLFCDECGAIFAELLDDMRAQIAGRWSFTATALPDLEFLRIER